jgi:hypothetical protein
MTSREWLAYFQSNVQSALDMPWDWHAKLTSRERELILLSLRAFQKGEGSEGKNLLAFARRYAAAQGDPAYAQCIDLFIKEEQKHSGFLALYLKDLGVPVLLHTFTDSVFRKLRGLAGLELSISVLITAEIIALNYYTCIRDVVDCPLLKKICERILADEARHVEFQSERLGMLRAKRGAVGRWATNALQKFLYAGTCFVVWLAYRAPYQAAGQSFGTYWRENWRHFAPCYARMNARI